MKIDKIEALDKIKAFDQQICYQSDSLKIFAVWRRASIEEYVSLNPIKHWLRSPLIVKNLNVRYHFTDSNFKRKFVLDVKNNF